MTEQDKATYIVNSETETLQDKAVAITFCYRR